MTIEDIFWQVKTDKVTIPEAIEQVKGVFQRDVIQWKNKPVLSQDEYHAWNNLKRVQEQQLRTLLYGDEQ